MIGLLMATITLIIIVFVPQRGWLSEDRDIYFQHIQVQHPLMSDFNQDLL